LAHVIVAFPDRLKPPVKVPVPEPPVAADWLQLPSEGAGVPDVFPPSVVHATLTDLPAGGPWPWPLAKAGTADAMTQAGTATAERIRIGTDLRISNTPRQLEMRAGGSPLHG